MNSNSKMSIFVACIFSFTISCTALAADVIKKPNGDPIDVANMGIKKTAQIKIWKDSIDYGDSIGKFSMGLFCSDPKDIRYSKRNDQYNLSSLSRIFSAKSEKLGYPKYESGESAFSEKLGVDPDFKIGLTLLKLHYDVCGDDSVEGDASVTLRFEIFSTKLQKIAYSKLVEAKFASTKKIKMEDFDDALFSNAYDQVFSDAKYVAMFKDEINDSNPGYDNKISIKNGIQADNSINKNSKDILESVVTIESSLGSGTGFFVGNEGYVISNYHVVGEAKYVKVKLSNNISVIGEILRKDPVRDIVLLKTPTEPSHLLFISHDPIKIGEEVYAIGSPFGGQLNGTLTRGIVSATRLLEDLNYIQSDVAINPGNSGGPLFNAAGKVVAVANAKIGSAGIGFFIPISEIITKLALEVK